MRTHVEMTCQGGERGQGCHPLLKGQQDQDSLRRVTSPGQGPSRAWQEQLTRWGEGSVREMEGGDPAEALDRQRGGA